MPLTDEKFGALVLLSALMHSMPDFSAFSFIRFEEHHASTFFML